MAATDTVTTNSTLYSTVASSSTGPGSPWSPGASARRSLDQESWERGHVTASSCVAGAIAVGARCVPDGTFLRSKNSTLLALSCWQWRPPLPRGSGGALPGRSSTGLFSTLELNSRSMIRCRCSMAVGDAAVPARGPLIARHAVKGDGGAVGGLLPHVRAQRRHGPRRWPSFSSTKCHQEISLKLYVRNFVKAWFIRHAAVEGVVRTRVMRLKSGVQGPPKQPFESTPDFD